MQLHHSTFFGTHWLTFVCLNASTFEICKFSSTFTVWNVPKRCKRILRRHLQLMWEPSTDKFWIRTTPHNPQNVYQNHQILTNLPCVAVMPARTLLYDLSTILPASVNYFFLAKIRYHLRALQHSYHAVNRLAMIWMRSQRTHILIYTSLPDFLKGLFQTNKPKIISWSEVNKHKHCHILTLRRAWTH